jgi:methionine-rich copper-binding protein CopC
MLPQLVALTLVFSLPCHALAQESSAQSAANLPAAARGAAATVDAFHRSLATGDTAAAARLLSDDALIFEAGGVERSKAEYAAHHLLADAEYSQAVPSVVTRRSGGVAGRLAWIASEGRTSGSFRGKAVDRSTAETMLLRRVGGSWKIAHIHWSSATARSAAPAISTPLLSASSPANGAIVKGPVRDLQLHFSPPARLIEVTISGPDGQSPMMVTAAGEQAHYSLPVAAERSGTYSVDWKASAKGHEDRGTFSFTVR